MDGNESDWEVTDSLVFDIFTPTCDTINHELISQLLAAGLDLGCFDNAFLANDDYTTSSEQITHVSTRDIESDTEVISGTPTDLNSENPEDRVIYFEAPTESSTDDPWNKIIYKEFHESSSDSELSDVTLITCPKSERTEDKVNDETDSNTEVPDDTSLDVITVLHDDTIITKDNFGSSSEDAIEKDESTEATNAKESSDTSFELNIELSDEQGFIVLTSSTDSKAAIELPSKTGEVFVETTVKDSIESDEERSFDAESAAVLVVPDSSEKSCTVPDDVASTEAVDVVDGQQTVGVADETKTGDITESVADVVDATEHADDAKVDDVVDTPDVVEDLVAETPEMVEVAKPDDGTIDDVKVVDGAEIGDAAVVDEVVDVVGNHVENVDDMEEAVDDVVLRINLDKVRQSSLYPTEDMYADLRRTQSVQYQINPVNGNEAKPNNVNLKRNATISGSINRDKYRQQQPLTAENRVPSWGSMSTSSEPSWLGDEAFNRETVFLTRFPDDPRDDIEKLAVEDGELRRESLLLHFVTSSALNKSPWCQVSRVVESNVLENMTLEEKNIQEAKFEILTTEASYYKSLRILKNHFIKSAEFANESIISKKDHHALFSFLKPIEESSRSFMTDLEKCWKRSIFLTGVFDIICHHSKNNKIYATYCSNLKGIKETLKFLKTNKKFDEVLKNMEGSEVCAKLPLESYLSLPMKRITGLDLLLKRARSTLLKRYRRNKSQEMETEIESCLLALDSVEQICTRSDRESQTNNRVKTMLELSMKLKFPDDVHQLPLISQERWLVMHGEMKHHGWIENVENAGSVTQIIMKYRKTKFKKTNIVLRLFLFSDTLLLAKKKSKSEDGYKVIDYCSRDHVVIATPSRYATLNSDIVMDADKQYKILLIMNENHEKKRVEMVLSCALQNERDLWLSKLNQKVSKDDVNNMVARKMVCVYPFRAKDPGHLFLVEGDEVMVTRILDSGWMEGVRMRGNKEGKFPPSRVDVKK